jgi:hypothetical protein
MGFSQKVGREAFDVDASAAYRRRMADCHPVK